MWPRQRSFRTDLLVCRAYSPSRHMLRHDWLVERTDYADGDVNIVWGSAYIDLQWPPRFGWVSFYHDGLPIRRLDLGPVALGYCKTHEWIGCGAEEPFRAVSDGAVPASAGEKA